MIELKQENASKLFDEMCNIVKSAPMVESVHIVPPRTIGFTVNGKAYRIQWYWNQSHLHFDTDAMFLFQRVKISSTWPNRYKANLQFEQNGNTVAVIPLVPYDS